MTCAANFQFHDAEVCGNPCLVCSTPHPEVVLIQPTGRHERRDGGLEREAAAIAAGCGRGFVLAAFDTGEWARALMPWADEAVSHNGEVGLHAHDTLAYVTDALLPWLRSHHGNLPVVIGGYSLGGLFALWAARQVDCFDGVAAASPSLWIRGWSDYAERLCVKSRQVYLSLGNREEHCRNRRMAQIGQCVRSEYALLASRMGTDNVALEWNQGGHFGEEAERTGRAFVWNMMKMSGKTRE